MLSFFARLTGSSTPTSASGGASGVGGPGGGGVEQAVPSQRTVQCIHCCRRFDVPRKAMILTCPACYKRVRVEDVVVSGEHHAPALETCGVIVVKADSLLVSPMVRAGMGLRVDGCLQGQRVEAGRVHLGSGARWAGDCRAGAMAIDPGATILSGSFHVGPFAVPALGNAEVG